MKKALLYFAVFMFFAADAFTQADFNTGAIEVAINQYGRIRLFTPDDGTRHLQRASILVGTAPATVFDYTNDAEELEPTVLVDNPILSDFEIKGAYDNSYSNLPPAVTARLNAYGWNNGGYIIVKFNVTNNEAGAINASAGLDIIPELNQEYGFDTVTYNDAAEVIRFHRGAVTNMGIKLLSSSLSSLVSTEWFEDYSSDENYWNWMNFGALQSQYASTTADGPVTITAQAPVTLASSESFDVYYALALGADEQTMLDNIAAAVEKYQAWFASVDDPKIDVHQFSLGQNHPNPVVNNTIISYNLPEQGLVTLKVYDATGNEVASLVNAFQAAGEYNVEFNTENLPAGMYFYSLRCNNQVKSNKMLLVR